MTREETLAAVASPQTPSEILEAIYIGMPQVPAWQRSQVRKKIVAHPNFPPQLLRQVSFWHGPALFANPIFPLLLFENPYLLHTIPPDSLYRYLSWECVPPAVLSGLAQHPNPVIAADAREHVARVGESLGTEWIGEVQNWMEEEARRQCHNPWMQHWYRWEAFPTWLQGHLNWNLPPRTIRYYHLPPVITEPTPADGERDRLWQESDATLFNLARVLGQHPDRLRLLAQVWLERTGARALPYGLAQAIGTHQNLPDDLARRPELRGFFNPSIALEIVVDDWERIPSYSVSASLNRVLEHQEVTAALARRVLHATKAQNYTPEGLLILLSGLRCPACLAPHYSDPLVPWYQRLVVALDPGTPTAARDYLARDTHRWVRAAARAAQKEPQVGRRIWEKDHR